MNEYDSTFGIETREERSERLRKLFDEIDAHLEGVPRNPWPKDEPIVEKFRRKGLIDED